MTCFSTFSLKVCFTVGTEAIGVLAQQSVSLLTNRADIPTVNPNLLNRQQHSSGFVEEVVCRCSMRFRFVATRHCLFPLDLLLCV